LPGEQEHVGMEDDFPLVDDQENETVRTNVAQAKPIVPWYKQEQNKTHFEAANRIFPFFDGMCEDENNDYVEVVKWSMSLPPCDTSIVMSEGMKTVALLVTKTRLTQIHSSFRSQYRRKLLRGSSCCTIPPFFLDTDTAPCLISVAYTPDIRRTADSPTVDRIMKLSKDEEAYEFYFKSFLRFVIPPLTFKNCIKQEPTSLSSKVDRMASSIKGARGGKDMVPFITVEEETLGLFFLDNYSDVWQAQLTQKVNTVTDVFPKYTTGKKNTLLAQKQKGVMIAKGHRLSNEGTARWNELYEKVTADRKIIEREVWEQILLNAMSTEATNGKKRPRAAVAQVAPPTTRLRFSMPE
jgi:hypothetical protein